MSEQGDLQRLLRGASLEPQKSCRSAGADRLARSSPHGTLCMIAHNAAGHPSVLLAMHALLVPHEELQQWANDPRAAV